VNDDPDDKDVEEKWNVGNVIKPIEQKWAKIIEIVVPVAVGIPLLIILGVICFCCCQCCAARRRNEIY
jgi:hypothetical protein